MGRITTHILDTALGAPAAGVEVRLARLSGDLVLELSQGVTDKDGRLPTLTEGVALQSGTHRLTFAVGDYFAKKGTATFYPEVAVVFSVVDATEHFHVPLLVSPFGYSTYRGS
jgi:5-hydroxyisourate hydrolase